MTTTRPIDRLRFGPVEVFAEARAVHVDGRPAKLGARAFDLLMALVDRRDRVVTKNELLELVWPGMVVEENNLQVHVSALRKLLGPQAIATIPGRGYRFAAAIDDDRPGAGDAGPAPALDAGAPVAPPAPPPAPGNVPPQLPPLIGREQALQELLAAVDAHPLVTLVGAAGMGKTTLALAAAQAQRPLRPDGVWLVALASVDDPRQLTAAVAQALGIALAGDGSPEARLIAVLRSQSLLLVLDNCEHLVGAAASLCGRIVAQAPGVRVLATSQELLNVPGEKVYKLEALDVPGVDVAPGDAERFGAVALFAARARAADPRFALDERSAVVVADICRALDGLPLAVELAAARVRLLGVQGVHERLGQRFRMLTGGARTAMARHQTLRAAFDWSHALLSSDEQTVFRRLGVFVGGFTLELAQAVAARDDLDEWVVLDALGALVDKSLVAAGGDETPRYRLLETARAYALEKLAETGETPALLARHAQAVHGLFVQTEEARYGEQGTLTMAGFMLRLTPEIDNGRAALRWATGPDGDLALAVGLAAAAAGVYKHLGLTREGLRWMDALQVELAAAPDGTVPAARAAVFWDMFAYLGGSARLGREQVLEATRRAEDLHRAAKSPRRLYRSLCGKVWALAQYGRFDEAATTVAEIAALEDAGWPGWLRSIGLGARATLCDLQGQVDDYHALLLEQRALLEQQPGEEALLQVCLAHLAQVLTERERYDEALALVTPLLGRGASEPGSGGSLLGHAITSLAFLGRVDEAMAALRRAVPVWQRDGQIFPWGLLVAMVLAQAGRPADAARVLGLARAMGERRGAVELPMWRRVRSRAEQLLAASTPDPAQVAHWQQEGEALDEADIAALVRGDGDASGGGPDRAPAGAPD